ncbi:MAG: ATP synthase F1 subunit delta [Actinomycetota bacterium]|nr:ATP synthase F1 subunit delta [Actinomycetota bacterium]
MSRVDAYATAIFEVARAEGSLSEVEDELFRFARVLEGSDQLRTALTDSSLPPDKRQAIIEDLLDGKASRVTSSLVSFVVGTGRGRELPAIIDRLVERAAAERQHEVAEVRSAVPLDDDVKERLATALSNNLGKKVEVKVVVDPSVMGGLQARVGDTVIDGTVRHRLDTLRESL